MARKQMTRREALRTGAAALLAGGAVSGAAEARAQGTPARNAPPRLPQPPGQPQSPGVRTLADVLDRLDWDPAERGPLLIVSPETTYVSSPPPQMVDGVFRSPARPEIKESGPAGYRLTAIDAAFARKVTPVGGLTALAPATMTVLRHKNLPEPDPYDTLTSEDKQRVLFSTLTPAQWKRMASPEGLGAGDLDRDQRRLFEGMLPQPFRVYAQAPGRPASQMTLSPAQLSGVRISMRRKLGWSFAMEGQPGSRMTIGVGGPERGDGAPTYRLMPAFGPWRDRTPDIMGVPIRQEVSNRPKPGDIDFAAPALDRGVALAKATMVGELVGGVAQATGVELYADPRYAELKVHARGETARAGDVLRALALCVTGTWRKVEDGTGARAWVLTDDLEGLATRHGRIRAWATAGGATAAGLLARAEARIQEARPGDMVPWADDDPLAPDPALRGRIDAHLEKLRTFPREDVTAVRGSTADLWRRREEQRQLSVPVEELPPAARELVRRQLESHSNTAQAAPGAEPRRLRTDAVTLDVQLDTVFVVPGLGIIESGVTRTGGNGSLMAAARQEGELRPLTSQEEAAREAARRARAGSAADEPALPIKIPGTVKARALMVAPAGPEEAAEASRAAVARGLNQLWIALSPGADPKAFGAVVAAARAAAPAVEVYAHVRPLRTAPGAAAGPAPDRNVLGETTTEAAARRAKSPARSGGRILVESYDAFGRAVPQPPPPDRVAEGGDFVSLTTAEARAALGARLSTIAATPGLAGVVLRDLVPPGYEKPWPNYSYSGPEPWETELGYTPEMRLAFLREAGVDPIDLLVDGDDAALRGLQTGFGMGAFAFRNPLALRLPFFVDSGRRGNVVLPPGTGNTGRDAGDAMVRWDAFRAATLASAHEALYRAVVNGGGGKLRVLREDWSANGGLYMGNTGSQFVPWQGEPRPTPPPPAPGSPRPAAGGGLPAVLALRYNDGRTDSPNAEPDPTPPPDRYARQVGWWLRRSGLEASPPTPSPAPRRPNAGPPPAGMVLDLSDRPVDAALPLLAQFAPPGAG